MPPSCDLELRPSRWLLTGLGLGHGLGLLAVIAAGLPVAATVGLLLVIGTAWSFYYSRHGWVPGPWFIRGLRLTDEHWAIRTGAGGWQTVRPMGSVCHPYLILITLAAPGAWPRALVIVADSSDYQACRRLRLLLTSAIRISARGRTAF